MVYIYGNDSFNSKINLIMYNKLKKAEEEEKKKRNRNRKKKIKKKIMIKTNLLY